MTINKNTCGLILGVFSLVLAPVFAAETELGVDQAKVDQWNRFSHELVALHRKIVNESNVEKLVSEGGYSGEHFNRADFFIEETYRDRASNRLLTRVSWEKDNPDNVHVLEVFIRDDQGRVERDYLVAYLPWGRNAPIQALVNLHTYNDGLHGFRQFDASGVRVYEQCSGSWQGQPVYISLESYEIESPRIDQPDYRRCFDGLPGQAGSYLTPQ